MDSATRARGSYGLYVIDRGSKMGKECFDMNTMGLESWKALELAGLLGWLVQDSISMCRALFFQTSKLKVFYTCREA